MEKQQDRIIYKVICHTYIAVILIFFMAGCDSMTNIDHSANMQQQNQAEQDGFFSNSGIVSYDITVLSNANGGASVINDNGLIAGFLNINGVWKAELWSVDENGNVTGQKTLGELPEPFDSFDFQEPNSINSSGLVVGKVSKSSGYVGFIYDSEMKVLPWFLEATFSWSADHINDQGVVSGHIRYLNENKDGVLLRGAVWLPPYEDEPITVSPLEEHVSSFAYHVSQSGIITGISYTDQENLEIVRWQLQEDGGISDPETVQSEEGYRFYGGGDRVNNTGDIAVNQSGWTSPALLRAGNIIELGLLTNHESGNVTAISGPESSGLIHISGFSGNDDRRAVYWSVSAGGEVSGPIDLGLPANNYQSSSARGINNQGWIAGLSNRKGSGQRPTLWYSVQGDENGDDGDEPAPPSGDLTASFDYSCGNSDTCTFTDTSTGDDIVSRDWNPELNDSEQITFTEAGSHTVTLTITDSDGNSASASETINCRSHPRHGIRCS